MEKPNEIHAVYAESLVFESNFGLMEGLASIPGDETGKRTQSIPEAAHDAGNAGKRRVTRLLIGDQFWPGF